jgi:nucleotide-binding universal stress UspA family protein
MAERLRSIAVLLDDLPHSDARLELAIAAASDFDAHLDGVFVALPPHAQQGEEVDDFARGGGLDDAIGHVLEHQQAAAARQRACLHAAAHEIGFTAHWRELAAQAALPAVAASVAAYDLLFLPPPNAEFDRSPWSPADLIFTAGVAGVVVPRRPLQPSFGRRIAIAWNSSHVARRAVADALPLLARAEAVAIVVVDEGRDDDADTTEVVTLLARHDVVATERRVRGGGRDVGDAILAGAAGFDADLVVAGAYGHTRWSHIVFGSTTKRLLHHAVLPILIAH